MANYNSSNTNVKIFVNDPVGGDKSSPSGHMAKEIYDYIVSLDSTDNAIISISHCPMNGERVMTMVVSGS